MSDEPQGLRTFTLTVPTQVMLEVIGWTDRQDLGVLPVPVAVFIANLGNTDNWRAT